MKIKDVNEAWGMFVLAREYLKQHAPHLLIESLAAKPQDPVVNAMYAELTELIALKDKIKWAIGQEEDRELDLHVRLEDPEALTPEQRFEIVDEKIESLSGRLQLTTNNCAHIRRLLVDLTERVNRLEDQPKGENSKTVISSDTVPSQEQMDKLIREFKEAEQNPLGGWITTNKKAVEEHMKTAADKVRECLADLPTTDQVHAKVSKELDELVDAAARLNIDLRARVGSALDKAAKAVAPQKPRAPRKPRSTKPTK